MDRISAGKAKSQVMRVARGGKDAFCPLLEKHCKSTSVFLFVKCAGLQLEEEEGLS